MTPDELESLLCDWGGYYRQSGTPAEDRSLTGNSALSRFGRPPKRKGVKIGRTGIGRRRLMAKGTPYRVLPAWAVDPASGTETRSYRAGHDDPRETAAIMRVQAAWLSLYRVSEAQANVVRCQYQVRGAQADRAQQAGIPLRAYRDHLRTGRIWILAKMTP